MKKPEYRLEYSNTAAKDFEEIASLRLMAVGENASISLIRKIVASLDKLKIFPNLGISCQDKGSGLEDYRFVISDNYLCFYKVQGKTVYIHRILDGRSDYARYIREYERNKTE